MKTKFISIEDKKIMLFGVEIFYIWILGILFALIGWLGENTFKLVDDGFIDSRFHLLPFIGAYVLVPFAVHMALGDADSLTFFGIKLFKEDNLRNKILSNITCFLLICLFVFLGELVVGNTYEYFFGVKLWNYSNMFLHITQYTCLFATLLYGLLAYLFFKFIFKPLLNFLRKHVPYKVAMIVCLTLGVLILFDDLRLIITIAVTNDAPQFWKLVFFTK